MEFLAGDVASAHEADLAKQGAHGMAGDYTLSQGVESCDRYWTHGRQVDRRDRSGEQKRD